MSPGEFIAQNAHHGHLSVYVTNSSPMIASRLRSRPARLISTGKTTNSQLWWWIQDTGEMSTPTRATAATAARVLRRSWACLAIRIPTNRTATTSTIQIKDPARLSPRRR
ncbi:hypothetical protein GCM10022376_15860 [Yimella lutea]